MAQCGQRDTFGGCGIPNVRVAVNANRSFAVRENENDFEEFLLWFHFKEAQRSHSAPNQAMTQQADRGPDAYGL